MTLNMDDDLDMSMRAPYISMSESSELPMLIAEDLMWGAQPDLKQCLNITTSNKKLEINQIPGNFENQMKTNSAIHQQKSTMESSLASLLCSQLLQHHKQQLQDQQIQQSEQSLILHQQPQLKIQIMDNSDNISIINPNTTPVQDQGIDMGL